MSQLQIIEWYSSPIILKRFFSTVSSTLPAVTKVLTTFDHICSSDSVHLSWQLPVRRPQNFPVTDLNVVAACLHGNNSQVRSVASLFCFPGGFSFSILLTTSSGPFCLGLNWFPTMGLWSPYFALLPCPSSTTWHLHRGKCLMNRCWWTCRRELYASSPDRTPCIPTPGKPIPT